LTSDANRAGERKLARLAHRSPRLKPGSKYEQWM
jgi:hypothetical protein